MTNTTTVTTAVNTTNVTATTTAPIFKDYSASISRMTIESLVYICHSKEFRNSYGPFKKAISKKAMLEQAIERLETLIETNGVPVSLRVIPGLDRSMAIVQKAWDDAVKGMITMPKTELQIRKEQGISFIEKTINIGRVCYRIESLLRDDKKAKLINLYEMGPVFYQVNQFCKEMLANAGQYKGLAEEMGVLGNYLKEGTAVRNLVAYIKARRLSTGTIPGIFVSIAYNGFSISIDQTKFNMRGLAYGVQFFERAKFTLTSETLSDKYLKAFSQVLVVSKEDTIWRYNISKHGAFGMELYRQCNSLSLFQVLAIITWKKVEYTSLLADNRNWVVVSHSTTMKGKDKLEICNTPFTLGPILALNELGKFWGVSNPDTFHKGLIRSISGSDGFCEVTPEGNFLTIAEKGDFEKDGVTPNMDASKLVARYIKLVKEEGELINLPRVFVVTDTKGSVLARDALSTGTVHSCTSILAKHGQCRFTSPAAKGGMKGTMGGMALVDKKLDKLDISLVSFGTMKGNKYSLVKLLGLGETDDLPVVSQYFENFGCELEGVFIDNMEVRISNNYTIEQYRPTNRDQLLQDWDMANEVMATRAIAKISNINEDAVFLAYVQELRDNEFEGDLVACLKTLEMHGKIKRKPNRTTITSSEFDMMAMIHGKEKAIELMDNLLSNSLNTKDTSKGEALKRSLELYTGTYDVSEIATMSHEEFYETYKAICDKHRMDPNGIGKFVSRDFLVDICVILFKHGQGFKWLDVSYNGMVARLPLGEMMEGNFASTSSVCESKVVVTGFLSKFFDKVSYSTGIYFSPKKSNLEKSFGMFSTNIFNEVIAANWSKDLGRLNATGLYAVLSPAWWTASAHTVVLPGASERFSTSRSAMMCKHPVLFDMSLAGIEVESLFPAQLVKGLDPKVLEVLNFVFSSTVFCPAKMLLSLQNDCDGDLGRITWHEGLELERFSAKTLNKNAVASKWFNAYVKDEEAFDTVKDIVWSTRTVNDIAVAMTSAQAAKNSVASYTNNAQTFAQRCEVDLRMDKTSKEYHTIHRILNIWVQEFSMMAIKHNQAKVKMLGKEEVTFNGVPKSKLKLPEFYLIPALAQAKMTGEEENPGEELLIEWLDDKGITKKHHGMKDTVEFAKFIHKALCNIGKRSPAVTILAKDHSAYSVSRMEGLGQGHIEFFNETILQDRLYLKSLESHGIAVIPTTEEISEEVTIAQQELEAAVLPF